MSSSDSDTAGSGGRLRRRPPGFRPTRRLLSSSGSVGQDAIPELPESNEVPGSASSDELTRLPFPIASSSHSLSAELRGENVPSNDSRNMFLEGMALSESPVSSPSPFDDQRSLPLGNAPGPSTLRGTLARSRPVKKSSLLSNVSSASDLATIDEPPPSPSRRRWDDLRQHFLSHLGSNPAPEAQASSIPPPPFHVPPRPSTPKQFRMPKLGFKQVVEKASEASVDQIIRLEDDILRASRAVRSVEPKAQKSVATSFNMGFMGSNASLGLSTPTLSYMPPSRSRATQRPPSLQSTTTSYSPSTTSTSLFTVISYYASVTSRQQHSKISLPHESEVLLALLLPFMSVRDEKVINEQLQAVEAFEIIVKTWRASSEVGAH